jgi:hypothetical protein
VLIEPTCINLRPACGREAVGNIPRFTLPTYWLAIALVSQVLALAGLAGTAGTGTSQLKPRIGVATAANQPFLQRQAIPTKARVPVSDTVI